MYIVHDLNSDTLQSRTRRYERERGFTRGVFVVVPSWENIEREYVPDWMTEQAEASSLDSKYDDDWDAVWDDVDTALTR